MSWQHHKQHKRTDYDTRRAEGRQQLQQQIQHDPTLENRVVVFSYTVLPITVDRFGKARAISDHYNFHEAKEHAQESEERADEARWKRRNMFAELVP